ncbi:MAG: glycosyltransferase [Caldilineaceae bacterium]
MRRSLDIVILGLSISSSWGNGHATTYRALLKGLHQRGHRVLFLERDVPWYANHRDFREADYCTILLYHDLTDLADYHAAHIRAADLVIVGSYVPEGVAVGAWVLETARGITAFYDIDTPVTLAKLERGDTEYLARDQIPRYDLYLTFAGGPTLDRLEKCYGAQYARPLYCSVDPDLYFPEQEAGQWDLGYMGTYSPDRQPGLEELLLKPAQCNMQRRFVVAGPNYPAEVVWPSNVARIDHLPPSEHRRFYNAQRFTLNITRNDMKQAGYAPSVRLFEAAACGTPIISDFWPGLDTFFTLGEEILVAKSDEDVCTYLRVTSSAEAQAIGQRARAVVLQQHTATQRAKELEGYIHELCR